MGETGSRFIVRVCHFSSTPKRISKRWEIRGGGLLHTIVLECSGEVLDSILFVLRLGRRALLETYHFVMSSCGGNR